MAPWPEQGNEPKAPDKTCSKSGENSSSETTKVSSGASEDLEVNATANKSDDKQADERNPDVSNLDDGQLKALLDEAITYKCPKDREGKSNLFRELLQEAEADETECGDNRRGGGISGSGAGGSRYYSNSSRRRGRRDAAVSERQTRGGSLQNLVHASSSEFDTGFGGYSTHGGRRRSKRLGGAGVIGGGRDCGVSVSARQREGGSLPSNVNVGGGMLTLSGLDYHHPSPTSLPFGDVPRFCGGEQAKRKEQFGHSSNDFAAASMPVHVSSEVNPSLLSSPVVAADNARYLTAPKSDCMVIDLGNCPESDDYELTPPPRATENAEKRNGASVADEEGTELEVLQRAEVTARQPNYTSRATLEVGLGDVAKKSEPPDVDSMCEKGSSGVVNGMEQNPLQLPSSYNSVKCIMGSTGSSRDDRTISATSKGSKSSGAGESGKVPASGIHNMYPMQHLSVLSLPPNSWIATSLAPGKTDCLRASLASERACLRATLASDVNRLTFHGGSKESTGESKNKALDENGNAVNRVDSSNSNSNERKGKQRKTKTNNDRNVIMSQNIEGHRGDKDIESLIKFIESNTDSKGKGTKNATSHSNGPVSFSSKQQRNSSSNNNNNSSSSSVVSSGTKPRRERGGEDPSADEDRSSTGGKSRAGKQVSKEHRGGKGSKLKKSNSLEEISKTKLEDLTSSTVEGEGGCCNSGSGAIGTGGEVGASLLLRRPKKQTVLDDGEFFGEKARVGDRRSWGTEEGQQYYCNDTAVTVSADESSSGSVPSQSTRKRRGGGEERRRSERGEDGVMTSVSVLGASEETEFHVVTKKQRRKKRRSSSGGRRGVGSGALFSDDGRRTGTVPMYNSHVTTSSSSYYPNREGGSGGGSAYYQRKTFSGTGGGFPPHDRTVEREGGMLYQYRHHRPRSPDHLRRKSTSSMPPSDKSDSSDRSDLDSVHSLPVSSTTPKLTLDQTSTSSGSTPQASYADIARMASTNVIPTPAQSQYSNINLNPGRWPAMTAPKSIPTTSVAPSSSSGVMSTTPPAPSTSNSLFITGPKLNIGVPPVSGSKVTTTNNPGGASSHLTVPPAPSSSVVAEDSVVSSQLPQKEPESSPHPPGTDATLPSNKPRPVPTDPRTKKDAMTNTTLDYKLIPPYPADEPVLEKPANILLEGEYPSLEESLVSGKTDSCKPCKSSHNTPFPNQTVSADSNVSAVVTFSLNPVNPDSCKASSHVVSEPDTTISEVKDSTKPAASSVVEASVEATVVIPRRQCAADNVATATTSNSGLGNVVSSDSSNTNRQETIAGGGNKSSTRSSIAGKKSGGIRPPVILMDEAEQEGAAYGELTFGFEVNEQLLLLSEDADPDPGEESPGTPVLDELDEDEMRDAPGEIGYVSTAVLLPSSSSVLSQVTATPSNAGEDFSARYREPTTQADNHDKIVTFVGLAWDDVLKEMSCTPVHSGSKVQYYSGQ